MTSYNATCDDFDRKVGKFGWWPKPDKSKAEDRGVLLGSVEISTVKFDELVPKSCSRSYEY